MPQGSVGLSKRSKSPAAASALSLPAHPAHRSLPSANLHLIDLERSPARTYAFDSVKKIDAWSWGHRALKRAFDLLGASLAIVLLSPVLLLIILCTSLASGSPIYLHRRVGKDGRTFGCLKFRTMVPDADKVLQALLDSDRQIKEEWLRDHKLKDDPRITRIGRVLRRTSLDELPQLWNVLRGDMSLVGPRPVVPEELPRYRRNMSAYLAVRPGLTGLWQVSGRNELTYARRVALDVAYVKAQSLLLDVYILLKTLPAVVAKSGAY